jgi:murein DD-endopeptidase MepM/ murein hydrolase activator NlpD
MMSKKAINRYKLPVPKNLLQRIERTSSPAHMGNLRNATDFIVDEETPVLAAANGIVSFVTDSSNTGGSTPMYWDYTNFIVIRHSNGEYSRYDHLSYYNGESWSTCQSGRRDSSGRNDWIYVSPTSSLSSFCSYSFVGC